MTDRYFVLVCDTLWKLGTVYLEKVTNGVKVF